MKILSCEQLRAAENAAFDNGITAAELMYRAGCAAAEEICSRYPEESRSVLVICGSGNNGGDGLVIASRLAAAGAAVSVVFPLGEPKTETARHYYPLPVSVKTAESEEITGSPFKKRLIVDALFGIGLSRGVSGAAAEIIRFANSADAVRVAIDVPSGVFCDNGKVEGEVFAADLTLTFIAAKPCFFLPPASEYCGEIKAFDIGAPVNEFKYRTVEPPVFPARKKNSHKGTFGKALLLCGSYGMCGAEILAARAALRTGAGIVGAMVCDKNYSAFCSSVPEAVTLPVPTAASGAAAPAPGVLPAWIATGSALLIGCGLGASAEARNIVRTALLSTEIPTVLDADGINAVVSDIELLRKTRVPLILTPHPGEMARLCGTDTAHIENDRPGCAARFAAGTGCIVILKGANTVIALPNGNVYFNTTGNPGLATGGSGDVLSGILVSLLAQGMSPYEAASAAVWMHGAAADICRRKYGERFMLPSDVIGELKTPEEN